MFYIKRYVSHKQHAVSRFIYISCRGIWYKLSFSLNSFIMISNNNISTQFLKHGEYNKGLKLYIRDPVYTHGLTSIIAWISNYIHCKMWNEITLGWKLIMLVNGATGVLLLTPIFASFLRSQLFPVIYDVLKDTLSMASLIFILLKISMPKNVIHWLFRYPHRC